MIEFSSIRLSQDFETIGLPCPFTNRMFSFGRLPGSPGEALLKEKKNFDKVVLELNRQRKQSNELFKEKQLLAQYLKMPNDVY